MWCELPFYPLGTPQIVDKQFICLTLIKESWSRKRCSCILASCMTCVSSESGHANSFKPYHVCVVMLTVHSVRSLCCPDQLHSAHALWSA